MPLPCAEAVQRHHHMATRRCNMREAACERQNAHTCKRSVRMSQPPDIRHGLRSTRQLPPARPCFQADTLHMRACVCVCCAGGGDARWYCSACSLQDTSSGTCLDDMQVIRLQPLSASSHVPRRDCSSSLLGRGTFSPARLRCWHCVLFSGQVVHVHCIDVCERLATP